jgi:hypothetical protein
MAFPGALQSRGACPRQPKAEQIANTESRIKTLPTRHSGKPTRTAGETPPAAPPASRTTSIDTGNVSIVAEQLDMETLVWTRGRGSPPVVASDAPNACPVCGSRRFHVAFIVQGERQIAQMLDGKQPGYGVATQPSRWMAIVRLERSTICLTY